jgi:multidrug resistance efflux pump
VTVEQAGRDRARAERLLAAGAVPARRAEEARAVEATAQARLQAAQARLAQYDATRTADGVEAGAKRFFIRAPIGGILCPGLSVMVAANNEIVFSSALGMADVE